MFSHALLLQTQPTLQSAIVKPASSVSDDDNEDDFDVSSESHTEWSEIKPEDSSELESSAAKRSKAEAPASFQIKNPSETKIVIRAAADSSRKPSESSDTRVGPRFVIRTEAASQDGSGKIAESPASAQPRIVVRNTAVVQPAFSSGPRFIIKNKSSQASSAAPVLKGRGFSNLSTDGVFSRET